MSSNSKTLRRILLTATLFAVAACTDDGPLDLSFGASEAQLPSAPDGSPGALGTEAFSVYTQNVYLGGDSGPLFTLDFTNLPLVIQKTNVFWNQVQTSEIAERMAGIADAIAEERPLMVGVQEAFQFTVLDLAQGNAVLESVDMLAMLDQAIAIRGLPYVRIGTQSNTSVTLPLTPTRVLSATDRIAMYRRTDVDVTSVTKATYAAQYQLGPVTLKRGWIRADGVRKGVPFHFVTTHLETQGLAPIQAGQRAELINVVMAGLEGVTILSGDLNSDAEHPGAPSWTPTYDALIAAGFVDAWDRDGHAVGDAGFTCCQAVDLRNGASELDERIDFVLVRDTRAPNGTGAQGAFQVDVVGAHSAERTPSGLWRADHAGLIAKLRLPSGLSN
jgi:endonuclease/exonuclease/phosphatase family metal-dependent hydrolase